LLVNKKLVKNANDTFGNLINTV